MLRLRDNDGWWLVTHPDHAELAGHFAARWGNASFVPPEPRAEVLAAIFHHDDGWRARDAAPAVTKAGLPSAFSRELVGKYAAFEEIDLVDYLNVRRRAVAEMAASNTYAAILVSMHTHSLLSGRADRTTISPADLPKLDAFLEEQDDFQESLKTALRSGGQLPPEMLSEAAFLEHFRLLQACDNLSLLACVDFPDEASLLHPLRTSQGDQRVKVERTGQRCFRLTPSPFAAPELDFTIPARFVAGERFADAAELTEKFQRAPVELLPIRVLA
jgi:hypothetical protein